MDTQVPSTIPMLREIRVQMLDDLVEEIKTYFPVAEMDDFKVSKCLFWVFKPKHHMGTFFSAHESAIYPTLLLLTCRFLIQINSL